MTSHSAEKQTLTSAKDLTEPQRQALLNVVYRIRSSLDVTEVLNQTALEIRQMLRVDRVGIFWFYPDSGYNLGEFVAESVVAEYSSAIANPVRDECFGEQYAAGYEAGRIQAVSDIYAAGLSQCHIDVLAKYQIRANLIVPLRVKGRLWGLFCVHQCRSPREWQAQEVKFIRHLGQHLDIAIQQGELLDHTLRQSERLRQMTQERDRFFSLSSNLFCVMDFQGNFLRLNPAWEEVLGYMLPELTPENIWSFVHPDDEAKTRNAFQELIHRDFPLDFEHRFRCANGDYKYLAWSGTAIATGVSSEERIYAIAHDITHRKKLEFSLAQRSQDLEKTVAKLQLAQGQLIQSEKMSSLGQLVAGVAHEINNPINFIYGNITHAREYIEALLTIVQAYQDTYPEPPEDLEELCEDLDLPFLLQDLPAILKSMKLGADRIRDIVLSLRNFSRLDEAELKEVNIHEGIDSTLLILGNRLKQKSDQAEITIQRNFGEIPPIDCHPGQLNQVFMNILSNAIDAILESNKATKGVITINTSFVSHEDALLIQIRDNGQGMDVATSQKIFDPFFTTKEIGKGTGLGMSISYQIITEYHNGSLTCKSEKGVGTEFEILLPRTQKPISPQS